MTRAGDGPDDGGAGDPECPAEVLSRLRAVDREIRRLEAERVRLGGLWVDMHPAEPGEGAREHAEGVALPIAGEGCPEIVDTAVPEFTAVAGMTPTGGARYLGRAVELRHRLPGSSLRSRPDWCRCGRRCGWPTTRSG